MGKEATVIIPTTKDRGPLLEYSVGSVLNQTVTNIEIFIIGDGVYEKTRNTIYRLMDKDKRIMFFDNPKNTRRGEEYRHKALQEAKGKIIFYLCDRDIMLPKYIENIINKKGSYNFFLSTFFTIKKDKSVIYSIIENEHLNNITGPDKHFSYRTNFLLKRSRRIKLSSISHTLELYNSLPNGWRTTPEDQGTDLYMAAQILNSPNCKLLLNITPPSFLYFQRGRHPGWPVEKRLPELKSWYVFIQSKYVFIKLYILYFKWILKCAKKLLLTKILLKGEN